MDDTSFPRFYAEGGLFMHLTTLLAVAALFYTLKGAAILQWADRNRGNELFVVTTQFATRLLALCLAVSAFGTLIGCLQVCHLVMQAPPNQFAYAMAKGLGIACHTVVWGLALSIPTALANALIRYRYAIKGMPSSS